VATHSTLSRLPSFPLLVPPEADTQPVFRHASDDFVWRLCRDLFVSLAGARWRLVVPLLVDDLEPNHLEVVVE
jgi:hypothetical protein